MLREISFVVASMSIVAPTLAADPLTEWAAGNSNNYLVESDDSVLHGEEPRTRLAAKTVSPDGFGSLSRHLAGKALQPLKGLRVMFTAHVRSKRVVDWAGLWMRVDGARSERLGFDNMQERPIVGDSEWQADATSCS